MRYLAIFVMQNTVSSAEKMMPRKFEVNSAMRNVLSVAGGSTSADDLSSTLRIPPGTPGARRVAHARRSGGDVL